MLKPGSSQEAGAGGQGGSPVEFLAAGDFDTLAPIPKSLAYLARVQYDPDIGFLEVARVIESDVALVANLLRLANSSWGHSTTPIVTVKDALNRLGMTNVLNLVLISSLAVPMKKASAGYELEENELARHSVAAYLAASGLPRFTPLALPKEAATAAFLHDIGKLLLGRYMTHELLAQIRQSFMAGEFKSSCEAEQHFLGTDHAEVGMAIVHHWGFPRELSNAIRRHHAPEVYDDVLLAAVKLCDSVAKMVFPLRGDPETPASEERENMRALNLVPSDLALICVLVEEGWKETEKFLQS
jgi:putative nucleotidyltransferase with HDIG domain